MARKPATVKSVTTLKHNEAKRTNIPTAEYQPVMKKEEQAPVKVSYPRKNTELLHQLAALHDLGKFSTEFQQRLNRDLDPQLIWRGKDGQDWSDLVVHAPPLYIQEKVHPKALIDDLLRETKAHEYNTGQRTLDLFDDFNGIPKGADKTEFYRHDQNWTNRMILGDSLQVMASLAEREGLRGKVQCIYFDPPYGIKFNSNFQWSTTSRDVKDGNVAHITREPEQVKAFRDTWRDGIHSYLTYLRDRLTVARDLLTESGSIFVQIGDENVHRVRAVMDEVFGDENCVTEIVVKKKGSQKSSLLDPVNDFILWYSKSPRAKGATKFHALFEARELDSETVDEFSRAELPSGEIVNLKSYVSSDSEVLDFRAYPRRIDQEFPGARLFRPWPITNGGERANQMIPVEFAGELVSPPKGRCWSHTSRPLEVGLSGMARNLVAGRLVSSRTALDFKRYLDDFPYKGVSNWWDGFGGASDQIYVVQTNERIVERCLLMATDPGDLVLDPTCGSGTTAYVAEQWGRRWITIDTSRVALALARARIMGARYPYYLLADSKEGQLKEAEVARSVPKTTPTYGNITHGFVYRRSSYITSGAIANNTEIDVIWDKFEAELAPLREKLTNALPRGWLAAYRKQQKYTAEVPPEIQEWEVPREKPADWPAATEPLLADFWQLRIARQKEIDASIAAKAESEYLYDKPYADPKKVRVAGPFTVESLSPHRVLGVDENDELIDGTGEDKAGYSDERDFAQMILENLKTAGVQQAHKDDKIDFTSLTPWPGDLICAEGRYLEGDTEKRAAIFIGPEFGTVSRPDLVATAREAGDADFDVLITCAFNYDAHSSEFNKLGRIPVLKARMNADLHMADDLKNTGKGNLFVIFGEPDIDILDAEDGRIQVKLNGVDVFHPNTGEVRSDGAEGIACWFIDTDYNEESFFVRHAYFLGANDPYKALKTTLKAEINPEAWATLNSDISRPFDKPQSGRIAVKVINHLGDEVMKIFSIPHQ
ncbi:MAG: DNA methyltransferase [Candidatus Nitrosoglobus sp.]